MIISADDFGISRAANEAIAYLLRERLIDRATIMPNMEFFEDAIALIRQYGLEDRIGIHLNFTEGRPLTDGMAKCAVFCGSDGAFSLRKGKWILHLYSGTEREVFQAEVTTQLSACRQSGLCITHADSHHHMHTNPALFLMLHPVLRRLGITSVRCSRNIGVRPGIKQIAKGVFNHWIRSRGFMTSKYFCDIIDWEKLPLAARRAKGDCEVMVHPTMAPNATIIDAVSGGDLVQRLKSLQDLTVRR